jgi:hypothetical protein
MTTSPMIGAFSLGFQTVPWYRLAELPPFVVDGEHPLQFNETSLPRFLAHALLADAGREGDPRRKR